MERNARGHVRGGGWVARDRESVRGGGSGMREGACVGVNGEGERSVRGGGWES